MMHGPAWLDIMMMRIMTVVRCVLWELGKLGTTPPACLVLTERLLMLVPPHKVTAENMNRRQHNLVLIEIAMTDPHTEATSPIPELEECVRDGMLNTHRDTDRLLKTSQIPGWMRTTAETQMGRSGHGATTGRETRPGGSTATFQPAEKIVLMRVTMAPCTEERYLEPFQEENVKDGIDNHQTNTDKHLTTNLLMDWKRTSAEIQTALKAPGVSTEKAQNHDGSTVNFQDVLK